MHIIEAQKHKEELEKTIGNLLSEFANSCGLEPNYVSIENHYRYDADGNKQMCIRVGVEVKL